VPECNHLIHFYYQLPRNTANRTNGVFLFRFNGKITCSTVICSWWRTRINRKRGEIQEGIGSSSSVSFLQATRYLFSVLSILYFKVRWLTLPFA